MKIFLLGIAAASLLAGSALAADVKGEIATAQDHANLAAQAGDIKGVHMHLHHAVNCIVGPKGAGFDATQINPCAGRGNGAMPDANASEKAALQTALDDANKGLAENDLAAAKKDAVATSDALKAIK